MASVNKAIIIGHLGHAPSAKVMPSGETVVNMSVATSESWNDKASGDRKEATEWHNVVIYGKLADIAKQYLDKGSMVYIEGKLKTRKWADKEGKDRYTTEIIASEMRMLSGKGERQSEPAEPVAQKQKHAFAGMDDDIPF